MAPPPAASPVRFGMFEVNPLTRELRKQGLKIKIGQQPFKLLLLLLERPGQIRTRGELRQQLWFPDTFVDFEHSLNKAVHLLREALGDSANNPRYIETVAGQGYRFIPTAGELSRLAVTAGNLQERESLAVLPLTADCSDAELEFLGKSIVEGIIDTVSRTPKRRVLAYSTVHNYRNKDVDPRRVGKNLHAQFVLTGEIVQRNDDLLLHVELIDVQDGIQLWGARFRETYTDALARPEKLVEAICAQLRAVLRPNVSRRKKAQTEDAA
jgi:TolB-like protein